MQQAHLTANNSEQISPVSFLPSTRGFKLAALNIRSLSAHIDELRVLLADCPIDVLAINETWLNCSITDDEIYIPGYKTIRRDRKVGEPNKSGESRGGVCFYVRSDINFSPRLDLSIDHLENFMH